MSTWRWVAVACVLAVVGVAWLLYANLTNPSPASTGEAGVCVQTQADDLVKRSPGLLRTADSDVFDAGNRTLRWDLVVTAACQGHASRASVLVERGTQLQDCAPVVLMASVTTGLSALPMALQGEPWPSGEVVFEAQRPDLKHGTGSFVVSLQATFASEEFALHDEQCLDGAVRGFTLAAHYRLAE